MTSPVFRPAFAPGASGCTSLTSAPSALFSWKNLALSGVTSAIWIPMKRVRNFAIANQRLDCRLDDLGWNGKSHPRERSGRRNQKRVDADEFAAGIHQRSTGVARIDRCIGLNELARLAPVARIGIRTIERADNAARHRKPVAIGIAESQHRLSGMQIAELPQGTLGKCCRSP